MVSAEVSDMDYLRSRMTKAFADDDDEDEGAPGNQQASWQMHTPSANTNDSVSFDRP